MEINGIIRINLTAEQIEAALLKANALPTATQLQQALDMKQDVLQFATDEDIENQFDK